jgi:hypothetical protein
MEGPPESRWRERIAEAVQRTADGGAAESKNGRRDMKHRIPDAQEAEILRRNGLDPKGVAVIYREEKEIVVLVYKTRDTVSIRQGDKKW